MSIAAIIITVVVAYTALTVFLGYIANRQSAETSADFFLASRSLSWPHLSWTYIGTWVSTMGFLGVPGFFYSQGFNWLLVMVTFFYGGLLLIWWIGPKLWALSQEHGYITPAELLAGFYKNRLVGYIAAFVCIVGLVPYCLIQTIAIAKVVSVATNDVITYEVTTILTAMVAAFYLYIGGLRAIVLTDIIQAALFSLVVLLGAGFVLYLGGGPYGSFQTAYAQAPDIFKISPDKWGKTLTLMVTWALGFLVLPHLWQRHYMARSLDDLKKSVKVQAIFYIFLIASLMTIGMGSAGFIEGLSDSDQLVPTLYNTYLPWALPVLVLATFAAGMSTLDSQLLTASSVFVRDIARPITGFKLEEARGKRWGRYIVLILIVAITALALLPTLQGPIINLASKGIGLVCLLVIPLIGPLFWKNARAESAIAGMVVGIAIQAIFEMKLVAYELPYGFGAALPSLVVGLLVFALLNMVHSKVLDRSQSH